MPIYCIYSRPVHGLDLRYPDLVYEKNLIVLRLLVILDANSSLHGLVRAKRAVPYVEHAMIDRMLSKSSCPFFDSAVAKTSQTSLLSAFAVRSRARRTLPGVMPCSRKQTPQCLESMDWRSNSNFGRMNKKCFVIPLAMSHKSKNVLKLRLCRSKHRRRWLDL
jgi:hypothetical protein